MSIECGDCGNKVHDTACSKHIDFVKNPWNAVVATVDKPTKDTNPKDACGIKKAPISTVSNAVMSEVGLAMLEGARKYGRHNYRAIGVRASVYYDAMWRHMSRWWDEGEDIDKDSGLNHITKAIAGLMVLRDAMICNKWTDDRPPTIPRGFLDDLNIKAADIIKKYPDPKTPYIQTNNDNN